MQVRITLSSEENVRVCGHFIYLVEICATIKFRGLAGGGGGGGGIRYLALTVTCDFKGFLY